MAKIPMAVRLSPTAKRQVELLSVQMGLTQTAVIETAVRALAKREKIVIIGGNVTTPEDEGEGQ